MRRKTCVSISPFYLLIILYDSCGRQAYGVSIAMSDYQNTRALTLFCLYEKNKWNGYY